VRNLRIDQALIQTNNHLKDKKVVERQYAKQQSFKKFAQMYLEIKDNPSSLVRGHSIVAE
jgi:hypothetical protein